MKMKRKEHDRSKAMDVVNLIQDLTPSERIVAAILLKRYNLQTGRCDPGFSTLAKDAGISRRSVIRATGRLKKRELFIVDRYGGRHATNQYTPNWPRLRKIAQEREDEIYRKVDEEDPEETDMSPKERQECHSIGDSDVTQTPGKNTKEETPGRKYLLSGNKQLFQSPNNKLSSKEIAQDKALKRIEQEIREKYPELYCVLVDKADQEQWQKAADMESRRKGQGIAYLRSLL